MASFRYRGKRVLVAVDCVIFGFDGESLKLLLIQRGFEPERGKWSLMGGFVRDDESLEPAAARILEELTGLKGVYMEQLHTFGELKRDPVERTVSVVYFALIDLNQYQRLLSQSYHAEWVPLTEIPSLIFDHTQMVEMAKERLRYKAALHPLLFELLPDKFTVPQLLALYEAVYDKKLDKRNFMRKLSGSKLLIRQKDKERSGSKKGAFFYKLDKRKYEPALKAFISLLPTKDILK